MRNLLIVLCLLAVATVATATPTVTLTASLTKSSWDPLFDNGDETYGAYLPVETVGANETLGMPMVLDNQGEHPDQVAITIYARVSGNVLLPNGRILQKKADNSNGPLLADPNQGGINNIMFSVVANPEVLANQAVTYNGDFPTAGGEIMTPFGIDRLFAASATFSTAAGTYNTITTPAPTKYYVKSGFVLGGLVDAQEICTISAEAGQLGLVGVHAMLPSQGVIAQLWNYGPASQYLPQTIGGVVGNFAGTMGEIMVIPEPATMGLLAVGALALIRRRRSA